MRKSHLENCMSQIILHCLSGDGLWGKWSQQRSTDIPWHSPRTSAHPKGFQGFSSPAKRFRPRSLSLVFLCTSILWDMLATLPHGGVLLSCLRSSASQQGFTELYFLAKFNPFCSDVHLTITAMSLRTWSI